MDIFKFFKNDIKIFVESGTFSGNGIKRALDAGYEKIYSCDINPEFVENAKKRFENNSEVYIEHGCSKVAFPRFFNEINERSLIFLDGHFMPCDSTNEKLGFGSDTVREQLPPSPLLDEIDIISEHLVKNHIIIIDDFSCFYTWIFGGISFDQVRNKIMSINSYNFVIEGNSVCFYI